MVVYASYSYDANGQTTIIQPPTGSPTTYTWDMAHRLKSAITPANQRFTFSYDYTDLRVQKQSPGGTESYLWDGSDLLVWMGPNGINELTARGATLARVIGHRSGGVNLNRQYHTDAMANVEAITDSTQATEVKPVVDAWGNLLSGSATDQPYDYTGGLGYWHDPDLGMQYVRARWLNPATGQWLSPDPVDSEPRYSYAHQMPTTQVDPSGRQSYPFADNISLPGFGVFPRAIGQRIFGQAEADIRGAGNRIIDPGLLDNAADIIDQILGAIPMVVEALWRPFIEWEASSLEQVFRFFHVPAPSNKEWMVFQESVPLNLGYLWWPQESRHFSR